MFEHKRRPAWLTDAAAWCKQQGYRLDETIQLIDAVRSAFKGAHLMKGYLGQLIAMAQAQPQWEPLNATARRELMLGTSQPAVVYESDNISPELQQQAASNCS